jgi:hypothetical protein
VVLIFKKEAKEMKLIGIFVVSVFLCSGVFAISGVSPSSYEVNFEPGYSGEFAFDFVLDGDGDLYVEGELAEYVSLNKDEISDRGKVVAVLNLPSVIKSFGVNQIFVGTKGDDFDVRGAIKVMVPYPERYVEIGLNAPNANAGEDVLLELELFGRGTKSVVVSPRIEVYKGGESVDIVTFKDVEVVSGEVVNMDSSLDTSDYVAGDYLTVAFADYDEGNASVENFFRLGEFSVGLINYTRSLRENKVNKFEILVESFWNENMGSVYADVNILNFGSANFVTPSVGLSAWEEQVLVGFLDMSKVDEDVFEAEIVLHYDEGSVSEIVKLNAVEGFDYVFWIVLLATVALLVFLFWRVVIFVRGVKKHRIKRT